jgi:hypothetical protein
MGIAINYERIRKEVPDHVVIVLACKTRTPEEVAEAMAAGAGDLGQNYVQEAEAMTAALGNRAGQARWHMIGPLQKNKMNKALKLFDVIQTLHSADQARDLNSRAKAAGRILSVLIEINSGRETAKSGVLPEAEAVEETAKAVSGLNHLRLDGLMTMGPFLDNPEDLRPYFKKTREIFDFIRKLNLPGADMRYLSMGMSDSYPIAIEEGSNMIRLGTVVFGPRGRALTLGIEFQHKQPDKLL